MWNAILLCYFIEYCSLAVSKPYIKELQEGLHTGGLCDPEKTLRFCEGRHLNPLIPIDYTLCLGNNSGVISTEKNINVGKYQRTTNWNHLITPYDIASKNQITIDTDDNSLLHIKCDKKYSFTDGTDFYNIIKLRSITPSVEYSLKIIGIDNNKKISFLGYRTNDWRDLDNTTDY